MFCGGKVTIAIVATMTYDGRRNERVLETCMHKKLTSDAKALKSLQNLIKLTRYARRMFYRPTKPQKCFKEMRSFLRLGQPVERTSPLG